METSMVTPDDVLDLWIREVGSDRWYTADPTLDSMLAQRLSSAVKAARHGTYDKWILKPQSALALMILLDQIPRNIYRGSAEAFASDTKAVAMAKRALNLGFDEQVAEPERQFFYLPLMHSESQCDQDRCVRLMLTRMPETGAENLKHAVAHRDIIRRFGRFPFRNEALGRHTTRAEHAWLAEGGYRA